MSKMQSKEPGIAGYAVILGFQIAICIIFAILTDYDVKLLPEGSLNQTLEKSSGDEHGAEHVASYPRK